MNSVSKGQATGKQHRYWAVALSITLGLSALPTVARAITPDALNWYKQGVAAERDGQAGKAEQDFRQATMADPNDYMNFVKLASVLNEEGKVKEAISVYHQAARLNGQDAMIWYSLGALYEQTNDLANAEKAYKASLVRDPNYQFGNLNLARVLIEEGNYAEAQSLYEKFLALYPDHFEARKHLANLLLVTQHPAEAATQYEALKAKFPDRFDDYVDLARALTRSDAPQKALEELKEAYAKEGNKTDIVEETGNAQAALGQYDFAIQNFTKALGADPQRTNLLLNIGQLYTQKKDAPHAIEAYNSFLAKSQPGDPQYNAQQYDKVRQSVANLYLQNQQYDKAVATASAILNDPDTLSADDLYDLAKQKAYALQMQGDTPAAIAQYQALLDNAKSVDDWQMKTNLALAYHKAGQLDSAVALYKQIYYGQPEGSHENSQPGDAATPDQKAALALDLTNALTTLGDQRYQQQDYQKALSAYAEATQFAQKDNTQPWLGLANTYYALKRNEEAYKQYQAVLAKNPNNVMARLNSAKLELSQENPQENQKNTALEELQKLAQEHPDNLDIQLTLAGAYAQNGDHTQAATVYQSALTALKPTDPDYAANAEKLYLGLADNYQALADKTHAIDAYEQAAKLNPANATTQYDLGVLYNDAGAYDKSADAYQKALAINPAMADARYGLAVTLEKQNKPKEALATYQQYATDPTHQYFQQALSRIDTLKQALHLASPVENATEDGSQP